MSVQERRDISNQKLILSGESFDRNQIIAQDAARTEPLLTNTVMAFVYATLLWVPFTELANVDGSSLPIGIYLGDDIPAADLVDGNIEDSSILIGAGCTVDGERVVWDQDLQTKDSLIGLINAEISLRMVGIYLENTDDFTVFEND